MISVEERKWYHLVNAVAITIITLAHATPVLIVHITLMVQLLIQYAKVSQKKHCFTKITWNFPYEIDFREMLNNFKEMVLV